MTAGWLNRLVERLRGSARPAGADAQLTRHEREVDEQSVDDVQAERFSEEHFGGIEPDRLFDDGRPHPPS